MSDKQKVLITLALLSETCQVSASHLSNPPSSPSNTPIHPLAVIRKDFLSLLSLVYTSATKITLTLTASEPAYVAAYPVVKDFVTHVSSLTTCATFFDEHGATLAGEVRTHSKDVCQAIRGLACALAEVLNSSHLSPQSEEGKKEFLIRTGAIHETIERVRKELPENNLSAVRTRWRTDKNMLEDSLADVDGIIEDGANGDEGEEDEGFGSDEDEDALEELGFTSKKLSEEELGRVKKIRPLLRICVLLHKRVLIDLLSKSDAVDSILDPLPHLSHKLLLATEEVVAVLYAPQDSTSMTSALGPLDQAIQGVQALLLNSKNKILPLPASLEDKMAGMTVSEAGKKQKDMRKWFETCFDQIHKLCAEVREGLESEGSAT